MNTETGKLAAAQRPGNSTAMITAHAPNLPGNEDINTVARAKKKVDFEDNLKALEDVVRQLEDGELSLESSLAAFEQGIKLTRECQTALNLAQQKVQLLVEKESGAELIDFEPDTNT